MSVQIPLFPLRTVLFPAVSIRIHVFEERYRLLTKLCLSEHSSFGVSLIKVGHEVGGPAVPYDVGTEAKILQADEYQDGRYDLLVMGARRFRIQELRRGKPYLEGKVEWIEKPVEDALVLSRVRKAVEARLKEYIDLLGYSVLRAPQGLLPLASSDNDTVSYLLAQILPTGTAKQQKLLEASTVEERLEMELDILNSLVLDLASKRQLGR